MSTFHENGVRATADRLMLDHQEWRDAIYKMLGDMNRGVLPQSLIDVIVQKEDSYYDVYDAFCVVEFFLGMNADRIAFVIIPMERGPFRDAMIEENNEVLAKLPKPFSATFSGGKGDEDGWLCWDESINAIDGRVLPPGRAPLEVGTTKASRSLAHMRMDRCLARWPYDHSMCHIVLDVVPRRPPLFGTHNNP